MLTLLNYATYFKETGSISSQTADNGIGDACNHRGNIHKEDKKQVKYLYKQPDGNETSNDPLTTWNLFNTIYILGHTTWLLKSHCITVISIIHTHQFIRNQDIR